MGNCRFSVRAGYADDPERGRWTAVYFGCQETQIGSRVVYDQLRDPTPGGGLLNTDGRRTVGDRRLDKAVPVGLQPTDGDKQRTGAGTPAVVHDVGYLNAPLTCDVATRQ